MEKPLARRQFFRTAGVLLAGAAVLPARFAQAQAELGNTLDTSLAGEAFWQQVRAQFVFTDDKVPMNAANLCPAFKRVSEHVAAMTLDIDRDCSFNNRAKFAALQEQARESVARQLQVSADEVALVRNTSEANNIINNGLALGPGDEVIIWDENHPTNHVAWQVRAARYGFRVITVPTPTTLHSPDDLLNAFLAAFTERTRVLAVTHVSNVSGIKLPIAELVRAAHTQDIFVHLDGAQTWGAMKLDLRQLGVDSFTASAHKWYMGPREVGLLYVAERHIDSIWPGVVASGWGNGPDTRQRGARKFESLGQRDDAALAALGLTSGMHDVLGADRIEQRTIELAQRLKQGVLAAGLELVTPLEESLSFGVCIIRVPAGEASMLSNRLYDEFGIAGAGTGGLRLCPAVYNTPQHVDRAVSAARALLS
jgi:isopenicillin-N epimerase